jgi:hypothetical protein
MVRRRPSLVMMMVILGTLYASMIAGTVLVKWDAETWLFEFDENGKVIGQAHHGPAFSTTMCDQLLLGVCKPGLWIGWKSLKIITTVRVPGACRREVICPVVVDGRYGIHSPEITFTH